MAATRTASKSASKVTSKSGPARDGRANGTAASRSAAKAAPKTASNAVSKAAPKAAAKAAAKAGARAAKGASAAKGKADAARLSLAECMRDLEKAGSAQTRKTWARHGAEEPMFGVSFATLKAMVKRIGVDHDLALQLWDTGNHDARTLAVKIADPARVKGSELDRWAGETWSRMCGGYAAMLAAESPHGPAKAREWLAADEPRLRAAGWALVGQLSNIDEKAPDAWFQKLIERIEKSIHVVSNGEREAMNGALIAIGGRNPALRKAATAAAKRIGKVEVDHGDTDCKTPDAATYIEKMWAHASAKKFSSPAAQERAREPIRTRC